MKIRILILLSLVSFSISGNPFAVGEALKSQIHIGYKLNDNWSFIAKDLELYKQYLSLNFSAKKSTRYDYWIEGKQDSVELYSYEFKKKSWRLVKRIKKKDLSRIEERKVLADLIESFLGIKNSIFRYNIVFTGRGKDQRTKELFEADFDGGNSTRISFHNGIVVSPSISLDGRKLSYSLIPLSKGKREVTTYLYNFEDNSQKVLLRREGAHSGVAFSPGEKDLFISLSNYKGNQIYSYNFENKKLTQETRLNGLNVDPSISTDGKQMTFLSSHPGRAMIYLKDLEKSSKAERLSFIGKFNSNPRFSPNNEYIIFSAWMKKGFDLFRLKIDTKEINRLTKDFGSVEEASYSFDGEFILLSSSRSSYSSRSNLFLFTKEGKLIKELTKGELGKFSPRWRQVF